MTTGPGTSVGVTVGVVSPGQLGSALGRVLREGGAEVVTTLEGRSARSRGLAAEAGLAVLPDLAAVVRASSVVLSVVPPGQARAVAFQVTELAARLERPPLLADLNAVSPADVRDLAGAAGRAGVEVVDGAVSGAPPGTGSSPTRLVLSGGAAGRVAALPWEPAVRVTVLDAGLGAASAAKMCTGAVRKGMSALVINALLTAEEHGVLPVVREELRRTLGRDPLPDAELAAAKAWRFVTEMEAVAATQASAGLEPALYQAVADVFRRTARSPLAGRRPEHVDRAPAVGAGSSDVVAALRPRDFRAERDEAPPTDS